MRIWGEVNSDDSLVAKVGAENNIPQDLKYRWLYALRSGDYMPVQSTLREVIGPSGTLGYCCLGILCQISGIGEWAGSRFVATHLVSGDDIKAEDHAVNYPPKAAVKYWGLNDREVVFPVWTRRVGIAGSMSLMETQAVSAARMNDWGFTFAQIADMIENFL